jgi:hypothetical protein
VNQLSIHDLPDHDLPPQQLSNPESRITCHMEKTEVTLQFEASSPEHGDRKTIRSGLSSLVKVGEYLFMASDEGLSLERLRKTPDGYGQHHCYSLADYLPLAEDGDSEIDIEGIDFENHYMWITGSHGLKRKKPDADDSVKKQIKELAKVECQPNRYLLARIPLVADAKTGEYRLHKSCRHPEHKDKTLTAAVLKGNANGNALTKALKKDVHLKHYLAIPGKDNGFDIEGLAIDGTRIFLGLRGPVLRGWAVVLELEMEATEGPTLHLKPVGPKDKKYKKHFLDLAGMGIREMTPAGGDLLILAGPTMDLDGTIALFRWKNALAHTKSSKKSMVYEKDVERLFDIPHGTGPNAGRDKAEGIALLDNSHLLVVYDSPADARKRKPAGVVADIFPVSGNNRMPARGRSDE